MKLICGIALVLGLSMLGEGVTLGLMDFGFTPEALVNNSSLVGIDPAGLDPGA